MSRTSFVIHLGPRWRMFASPRDGLTFLGTVQRGIAGIGALARNCDGGHVQVNGDVMEVLDARRIGRALRMLPASAEGQSAATRLFDDRLVADAPRWPPQPNPGPDDASPSPAPRPVIMVKKRRVAVRPTVDVASASERAGSGPAS